MAVFMFTLGNALSLKDDSSPNSGGKAYFYEPGTATAKTTYNSSALSTANANPVVFDSAGRASIYFEGNADVKIYDSADVQFFTQLNVNPSTNTTITALSSATDLTSAHNTNFIEASGTTTLTLTAASTLGAGWYVHVKNAGVGTVTIARASAGDSVDGTAANITIAAGHSRLIVVNAAETGFLTVPGISGNTAVSTMFFTAGIGPHYIQNLGLSASVATKALTVALKTKALADPSSTDPVQIAFRNATLTTGDYSVVSATAATSVVVPSGGTLGFTAAEDGLIYVYAINNAGTIELAVAKKALFDESIVHSTTAISATADSDNVLYSTTARTNVAVRLIGRIRITTGAVAGEWDNAATRIEVGRVETSVDHFSHPVLKSGTAIATTSGVTHDFTGIPPGVKRIVISFEKVSTNGTSIPLIQIGDSGGIETSGYLSGAAAIAGTSAGSTNFTAGFGTGNDGAATYERNGSATLTLLNAATNTWSFQFVLGHTDGRTAYGGGSKSLSAVLDRVRLTTINGTDVFDLGSVNILYE